MMHSGMLSIHFSFKVAFTFFKHYKSEFRLPYLLQDCWHYLKSLEHEEISIRPYLYLKKMCSMFFSCFYEMKQ